MSNMIVTTLDGIAGRMTQETLGVVRGTSLWTRRVMKSSFGGIRHMQVTGVKDLDQGLNEAKEQAHKAMMEQARALDGDSIIGVKIDVVEMSNGVFCVNATGTAVKTLALPSTVPSFDVASPAASAETDEAFDFDMSFVMAARPSFEGSVLRH
jgi:uncharacterized protein YbjQ (UPF0145 family)